MDPSKRESVCQMRSKDLNTLLREIKNKDVLIGMLKTLVEDAYHEGWLDGVNCHHSSVGSGKTWQISNTREQLKSHWYETSQTSNQS